MSTLKKISYLISNQIPEYIRDQNPKFVAFLEAYYSFLESTSMVDTDLQGPNDILLNLEDWIDIDSTLDTFVDVMRKQYAWDIPESMLLENRRLIKNIFEFYETKGSVDGTKLFFRLMYDTYVQINFPNEVILRISNGVWTQQKTIKIVSNGLDTFDLVGKKIKLKYVDVISGGGIIPKEIETVVENVSGTNDPEVFKLTVDIDPDIEFFDENSILDFRTYFAQDFGVDTDHYVETSSIYLNDPDNLIKVWSNDTLYGSLTRQVIGATITMSGSKFKRGENFFIDEQGALGEYFSQVYDEFDTYAGNNTDNRIIIRVMDIETSIVGEFDIDYFLEDYTNVSVEGAISNVKVISTGYKIFQKTFTALISSGRVGGSFGEIALESGYVLAGEKHYEGSRGLISSVNKMQDGEQFQPYSYVIQSELSSIVWEPLLKSKVHPAGLKVIGQQLHRAEVNMGLVAVGTSIISGGVPMGDGFDFIVIEDDDEISDFDVVVVD